jgi:uncharacterized protein involved in response to NO
MSTPAALQRRRDYDGPALFSYGFRPFFLAAGLLYGPLPAMRSPAWAETRR